MAMEIRVDITVPAGDHDEHFKADALQKVIEGLAELFIYSDNQTKRRNRRKMV